MNASAFKTTINYNYYIICLLYVFFYCGNLYLLINMFIILICLRFKYVYYLINLRVNRFDCDLTDSIDLIDLCLFIVCIISLVALIRLTATIAFCFISSLSRMHIP